MAGRSRAAQPMCKCLRQGVCSSSSPQTRDSLASSQVCLAVCLWLSMCSLVTAQAVPLASIKPLSALSFYAGRDAIPRPSTAAVDTYAPGKVLSLVGESEVSYTVPDGESWFEGTVVYHADPKAYTPLLIRIWCEGKLLWERGMPGHGPQTAFSIPVMAA